MPDPTTSTSTTSTTTSTSSSTTSVSLSTSSSTSSTTSSTSTSFTTSSSTSVSTSTSTTTTIGPGGICWGEQHPAAGEVAVSWQARSDGVGDTPLIQYGADWGKIKLETIQVGHSSVIDTGDTQNKTLTVAVNVYGAGSGGGGIYIRGQMTSFAQDAALPAWQLYSGPIVVGWRWIQVRLVGPVG